MSHHNTLAVQGVIFDLDGTLVSSRLDFAYLKRELSCPHGTDLLEHVANLPDTEQSKAMAVIHQHELEDAAQSTWLPGARRFVENCSQADIPMAIITRNMRDAAMLKIHHNKIPIETVLTREDAPAKPDPTGLLQVARQWNIKPDDLIYIGDFLYDIDAAINADMWSCLYAPKERPNYAHKASIVISDFAELDHRITFC